MNWEMVTAFATSLYTIIVGLTAGYIYLQFRELNQTRTFQVTLAIMNEVLSSQGRDSRRYIYEKVPQDITRIEDSSLKQHLEASEVAMTNFDLIGYFVMEGYTDPTPLIPIIWPAVWKCWKKSENLVRWAREKRGVETYLSRFEYLFNICEEYRKEHSHNEPVFY